MKTHVITVSNNFLGNHPRAGEPTNFEEKLISGDKKHTIRSNRDYWEKIIHEVNAGNAILSVRKWSGKPYRSKQVEICQYTELGYEHLCVSTSTGFHGVGLLEDGVNIDSTISLKKIAENDGLSLKDFKDWFGWNKLHTGVHAQSHKFIIIHFTKLRYNTENLKTK